ncbi:MAG: transferrin-binding protein-like solute binding protein [Cardiobacteriaceae bacterium]|nr:transferrin-binding protein-like solute binding protein [Cardiobacteriaceae bacterium]
MKKLWIINGLLALCLTACGGGGGGDSISPSRPNSTLTPVAPVTPVTPAQGYGGSVVGLVVNERTHQVASLAPQSALPSTGLDSVVIDGQSKTLIPLGFRVGRYHNVDGHDEDLVVFGGMKHMRFGIYDREIGDMLRATVFTHGLLTDTAQMPAQGKALYLGEALWLQHDIYDNDIEDKHNQATFNVDFSNKTIDGLIGANLYQPIHLKGTISGNAFGGTSNSGIIMQGNFFGDKAEELGGTFHKNAADGLITGAFGAIKR